MMLTDMTVGHLVEFRKNVREIDLEEVERVSGIPFDSHLPFNCKVLLDDDGTVMAIGNVEENGLVWMITTTAIETRKVKFLRYTRRLLREYLKTHAVLHNVVYKKNTIHVEWLKWLGAEIIGENEEFYAFILKRKE